MTKDQMAERLADEIEVRGLSHAVKAYMLSCLRVDELKALMTEYGLKIEVNS